mmetsp:Transcript_18258/g.46761  ORF Transcript_18258/g.46761 Transcript_18258/m.46761 type:complete len:82 (-) Transcript_18258:980-1225(-)
MVPDVRMMTTGTIQDCISKKRDSRPHLQEANEKGTKSLGASVHLRASRRGVGEQRSRASHKRLHAGLLAESPAAMASDLIA